MRSTFTEHQLPNGLRIVCETMPQVSSAAFAFLVRTGARHEQPIEHGVSHFLEHMCFKGTAKRDCRSLNVRFDELGSIYNAFTGKEHTVYYGWVPAEQSAHQIELLADMMRPTVPPEEFDMERNVVLEEIAMTGDSFEHNVSDFLHQVCFDGHPLSHEILGEKETIQNMQRETMVDYLRRRYSPDNMYLLATGAVEPEAVFAEAARCSAHWQREPNGHVEVTAPKPMPTGVFSKKLEQFKQQSVVLIYPSVAPDSEHCETIDAFCSMFGGANSRCYWDIVQKGICSQAGAVWLTYADFGMLAFYADGEPERAEEMLSALKAEIKKAMKDGFLPHEIQRVKNRRRMQLAVECENPRTRLMQMIEDIETEGRVLTPDMRLASVEAVNMKTVRGYFEQCPLDGDGLLLSVGPGTWPGT